MNNHQLCLSFANYHDAEVRSDGVGSGQNQQLSKSVAKHHPWYFLSKISHQKLSSIMSQVGQNSATES